MFDNVEDRITKTEQIALNKLRNRYDHVIRTTPRSIDEFEEEFPEICELVSKKVSQQGVENLGNVFRPGVPDLLGFDEDGDYCFVEVKGGGDGLRHSQIKWFRDFKDVNSEIWFADDNDGITEKMDSEKLNMYSLKNPGSKDKKDANVVKSDRDNYYCVEISKTLAAMMNLDIGDKVSWKVDDRSVLKLDTD